MSKRLDISGQRFSRLIALRRIESVNGRSVWECLCDCGKKSRVTLTQLRSNKTKTCGCRIVVDQKDRFWSKVNKLGPDDCWLWKAYLREGRYGGFGVGRGDSRKMDYAHRVAWELSFGKIPARLFVCHTCDVMACVNPRHLFLGTHLDNMRDMNSKGRRYQPDNRGEKSGASKLTERRVLRIRRFYGSGKYTQKRLGELFGVTRSCIKHIVTGNGWAHI